jgi:hypothetical protein
MGLRAGDLMAWDWNSAIPAWNDLAVHQTLVQAFMERNAAAGDGWNGITVPVSGALLQPGIHIPYMQSVIEYYWSNSNQWFKAVDTSYSGYWQSGWSWAGKSALFFQEATGGTSWRRKRPLEFNHASMNPSSQFYQKYLGLSAQPNPCTFQEGDYARFVSTHENWFDPFTWAPGLEGAVYQRINGTWQLCLYPYGTAPMAWTGWGPYQSGDYLGDWLIQDLVAALKKLNATLYAISLKSGTDTGNSATGGPGAWPCTWAQALASMSGHWPTAGSPAGAPYALSRGHRWYFEGMIRSYQAEIGSGQAQWQAAGVAGRTLSYTAAWWNWTYTGSVGFRTLNYGENDPNNGVIWGGRTPAWVNFATSSHSGPGVTISPMDGDRSIRPPDPAEPPDLWPYGWPYETYTGTVSGWNRTGIACVVLRFNVPGGFQHQ